MKSLEGIGYRVLEHGFPRRAYVVIRDQIQKPTRHELTHCDEPATLDGVKKHMPRTRGRKDSSRPVVSREQVLAIIHDPRNRRRKLWTASVVLDRLGVYRRFELQTNYRKNDRIRVRRILAELCEAGLLQVVKSRHTLHSPTGTSEIAYGLPEEAPTGAVPRV